MRLPTDYPQEVKEQGCGENQAVDAVQDTAVTGKQGAGVLDPDIAFDGRHCDVADETRQPEACTNRGSESRIQGEILVNNRRGKRIWSVEVESKTPDTCR